MNCFETQHRAVSQKLICLPLFRARSTFVRRSPEENGIGHHFSAVSQLVEKSFFDKLSGTVNLCRFFIFITLLLPFLSQKILLLYGRAL